MTRTCGGALSEMLLQPPPPTPPGRPEVRNSLLRVGQRRAPPTQTNAPQGRGYRVVRGQFGRFLLPTASPVALG